MGMYEIEETIRKHVTIEDFEKPHFLNCFDFQSRRCANNKLLFSEGYSKFSIIKKTIVKPMDFDVVIKVPKKQAEQNKE